MGNPGISSETFVDFPRRHRWNCLLTVAAEKTGCIWGMTERGAGKNDQQLKGAKNRHSLKKVLGMALGEGDFREDQR